MLETLAASMAKCTACKLHAHKSRVVPGEGPEDAQIVFIGEAPGRREDKLGRPFVGRSGDLLNDLLASIGLDRERVFITNVIKCRPPSNRAPQVDEVRACTKRYLDRQLEIIQPRMIVTLGRFALNCFFPGERISDTHGQPRQVDGTIYLPLYHPPAALRRTEWRQALREDVRHLSVILSSESIIDLEPLPVQQRLFQ